MRQEFKDIIKAVEKLFNFHSYGFEAPRIYDGWVLGPVFIAKLPMGKESIEFMTFNVFATGFHADPNDELKFRTLLGEAKHATQEIKLSTTKHESKPKCTYRLFTDEPGAEYPLELAYPAVMLAKKLKVNRWTTTPGATNVMCFGYKDDELVALFAGRRVLQDHAVPDAN